MTMLSAAETKLAPPPASAMRLRRLGRERGLVIAVAVFLVPQAIAASIGSVRLSYYDLSQMSASGATLALAAIGQTIVVLSGGFDLSAGAVISLVNVVLATWLQWQLCTSLSQVHGVG